MIWSRQLAGMEIVLLVLATLETVMMTLAAEPVVIAHRGASGYLPEHTLPSKALAYGQGADYLEQDVVLSKDGVPIVLHDVHLDTVTDVAQLFPDRGRGDGRYYALDFTLAELRRLRVHERVDHRTGRAVFPGRFPPEAGRFRLPTLREELEMIQGMNRASGRQVGVYPEIKSPQWHRQQGCDPSPIVLQLLRELGYDDPQAPIYVQCFDADELKRWRRELGAKMKLVQLLTKEDAEHCEPPGLQEISAYAQAIGPPLEALMQRRGERWEPTSLVAHAHRAGLAVHPWTLRADALPPFAASYDQLLKLLTNELRVDGYFTDFPDLRSSR